MKKFSDLNIQQPEWSKIFDCKTVSISDILNKEIEVLDFIANCKTVHGDGRYIINIKVDGEESKFFTNSKHLQQTIDMVEKEDFPFLTTIKCTKLGKKQIYQFT